MEQPDIHPNPTTRLRRKNLTPTRRPSAPVEVKRQPSSRPASLSLGVPVRAAALLRGLRPQPAPSQRLGVAEEAERGGAGAERSLIEGEWKKSRRGERVSVSAFSQKIVLEI